jgi:hypothetical protein
MKTSLTFQLLAVSFLISPAWSAAQEPPPKPPQIASVTPEGVQGAGWSVGTYGLNAYVGVWSGTYRVRESKGDTKLRVTINVNDGGQLVFSHWLQTFDTTEYDWSNIYLETPTGRVNFVTKAGRPTKWEPPCCIYWATRTTAVFRSLNPWKNQQVTLVVELRSDGYGDETQMNIVNLAFPACRMPYPAELTDPEAIAQETQESLDLEKITPAMKTALDCLGTKIREAGGRFEMNGDYVESAYRNPEYQAHLDEIWRRWQQLKDNTQPECAAVKEHYKAEFSKHRIRRRPATRMGPHPRGVAVDLVIPTTGLPLSKIVELANACKLDQPLPLDDDNHFVARPPSN